MNTATLSTNVNGNILRVAATRPLHSEQPELIQRLFRFVAQGDIDTVAVLLNESPMRIHSHDHNGAGLLHRAVESGKRPMIQYLLDRGADLGMQDFIGFTPLHLAVLSSSDAVILDLIERGADLNARTHQGSTVLDCARKYCRHDVAKHLLALGAQAS